MAKHYVDKYWARRKAKIVQEELNAERWQKHFEDPYRDIVDHHGGARRYAMIQDDNDGD